MENSLYSFYYKTYPFDVATRLCIQDAQKLVNRSIESKMELYKRLDDIRGLGIIPTLSSMQTAYDIIQRQIHDLIREEANKRGFKTLQ